MPAAPRGPFVVSILEVQRALGTQRSTTVRGPMPGIAITDAAVVDGADAVAEITVESSTGKKITVTGQVRAPLTAVCRRCLGPVEGEVVADLLEVYEPHPVEGETYPLTADWLDLEPMLRDALLLSLPIAPICRPDCPGPAPEGFPVTPADDEADAEAAERPRDPRWAALDDFDPGGSRPA